MSIEIAQMIAPLAFTVFQNRIFTIASGPKTTRLIISKNLAKTGFSERQKYP